MKPLILNSILSGTVFTLICVYVWTLNVLTDVHMLSVQFDDEIALTLASMEDSYAGIQVLASELNDFGRIRRQVANSMQQSRAKANPLKVDKFKLFEPTSFSIFGTPALSCKCSAVNRCPAGLPGRPGLKGLDGIPGKNGLPGRSGIDAANVRNTRVAGCFVCPQGRTGEPGPIGRPGKRGIRGSKGLAGRPGNDGEVGRFGQEGPMGETGAIGQRGPPGLPGKNAFRKITTKGKKGQRGKVGKIGPIGNAGHPGAIGKVGVKGIRGSPGMNAVDGSPGIVGLPGKLGTPGRDATYCSCPPTQSLYKYRRLF